MHLNISKIEDFEEIDDAYILKKEILDANDTEVDVKIEKGMLIISTTTKEKEKGVNESNTTIITTVSSSEISLFIPINANSEAMRQKYENGILEIKFPKK